ncbi:MAG TPA: GWxTD domain-containing protein [Bacteroidales bacterium]|nr:GWxTD domain-containing protein [Bacteroidales bacterium]HCI55385.1 hypothetical protein [Bacteroidales bacterium]HOU95529.1 GWxTD domain-containing protein [Bacteroidales bacterium]HQG36150.1 GWxTD domain-containing protein [Bacteroidales bacterium]HQG53400.1 GWxTD domain-containing protein [Bacteroidales bacterium]
MKKNRTFRYFFVSITFIAVLFLFFSCASTKTTFDTKDLSYLYNPLKNTINPAYGIFNETDDRTVLSVKLFAKELFFTEANPAGVPMAQMFLAVKLYNMSSGRTIADTAYYDLNIVKEQQKEEYLYHIPLKVRKGTEYMAEVKIMDKIRDLMIQSFVPFNTLSELNRYNFYAREHFRKSELLKPYVRKDEFFNVIYGRKKIDSLFIAVYKPSDEIPYPPSMILPERSIVTKPDTVVAIPYSDTLPLMLPQKGIFLFKTARDINEGYTIFNFGQDFPTMNKPEEMIKPLVYLLPQEKADSMAASPKPKVALDEFWLSCGGGNIEKARELIRIFYTRTIFANYYFTSWKEGWRTDRGMIYIIYGPPDKLYKSYENETWGYRKPVVRSGWGTRYSVKEDYLFFTFKKRNNVFSDNDFYLSRSESVVTFWDKAVQSWRKGIVFRLDNPDEI